MDYRGKLYNDLKNIIIEKTNCEENSELLTDFKNHLYGAFDGIITNDKEYSFFLQKEAKRWMNKSKEEIEDFFNPDIAYMVLQRMSHDALDLGIAKLRNNTKIDEETYQKLKKEMEERYNQVREENKASANLLLSEGLLDLEYAHTDTDITSMRLGIALAMKKSK